MTLVTDKFPDLWNSNGCKAWIQSFPYKKEPNPTVKSWIVYAPYAHPLWDYYSIALIHLRPCPGYEEAKINMENATHEILVLALNPEFPVTFDEPIKYLTPINFAGQFYSATDELAIEELDKAVKDVIDKKLNPDTDYIQQWFDRFGESNKI